jgi:regulator of protease activity HflC (stomatin/prohibitin superfamily)
VSALVNAVAYFRIVEPKAAIVQIENFMVATSQIAQTTLRSLQEKLSGVRRGYARVRRA